jgi:hypothetical protein
MESENLCEKHNHSDREYYIIITTYSITSHLMYHITEFLTLPIYY